jgi:uncharacterized protein
MNVDQVLRIFREEDETDAREAVQWVLAHWDEASDRLLSRFRAVAASLPDDYEDKAFDEGDAATLFYLVHLFAERRDKRAYVPLCARLQRERDADVWLADAVGDTLPGVLVALCDGDPEPLQRVIESAASDEFIRAAAFNALCYVVRFEQALGDEAMLDYLRHLYEHAEPRGPSHFWVAWADAVALLGFSGLAPDVARLFSRAWIEPAFTTIQEFHGMFAESRSDPKAAFDDRRIAPFASTIELLEAYDSVRADDDGGSAEGRGTAASDTPYINPVRDVGRNDPCPCGSGKKYKKCCLVA